jgi:fatty acid desaturase
MLRQKYCHANFSIREARQIVQDLFEPRPAIYWTDLLLTMAVGLACFRMVLLLPMFSVQQIAVFVVSCLALYRGSLFTHELVHLRSGSFGAFRVAWNMLCGIPFLMPSFLYHTHLAHHARKHYGTPEDGEYMPLASSPRREILIYLCQPFVIPLIAVVRFLICTPIAWVNPRFRRFVQERMSSMVMDPMYVRPLPTNVELRLWRRQEAWCFVVTAGFAAAMLIGKQPWMLVEPWQLVVQSYCTAVGILMLNAIRTLGAHRFMHNGDEMTFVDQLLDSVNYPRHPILGALWAPVGLRFHALHHLFPSMPYHSLAEAHRRLMRELPADSPYRLTESPGLFVTLQELWRKAGKRENARAGEGYGMPGQSA